jgi:cysteinyl-tRNA synthetase
MDDDMNTSRALGVIHELIKKGYETGDSTIASSVKYYMSLLGFADKKETIPEPYADVMAVLVEVEEKLQRAKRDDLIEMIKSEFHSKLTKLHAASELFPRIINLLMDVRNIFRKEKNYEFADYIRNKLMEKNIIIEDQGIEQSSFRLEVK